MKQRISTIVAILLGASFLSAAHAGPDEAWKRALQKSHEREQAARAATQAEMAALREKCGALIPGQK